MIYLRGIIIDRETVSSHSKPSCEPDAAIIIFFLQSHRHFDLCLVNWFSLRWRNLWPILGFSEQENIHLIRICPHNIWLFRVLSVDFHAALKLITQLRSELDRISWCSIIHSWFLIVDAFIVGLVQGSVSVQVHHVWVVWLPFLALKSFEKGSFWVRQLYLIIILIICIFLFTLLVIFCFI